MEIVTRTLHVATRGMSEVVDITGEVMAQFRASGLKEGSMTVFVTGSTASVTTTEFEPGLRADIPAALERLIPSGTRYRHDDTWNDGNGFSHLRAAFLGPSLTVPFVEGELALGTWQQIVLIDHDNRPRQRTLTVQFTGIR